MAERQLPKLHTRVRFPSPAPATGCMIFPGADRTPGSRPSKTVPRPTPATLATRAWAPDQILEVRLKYSLAPLHCRPWLLNGLSLRLIESHYENNYGGAVRRLNAIDAQLAAFEPLSAPPALYNALKREELVALNSSILHEL